jgi:putative restriction endonuclease
VAAQKTRRGGEVAEIGTAEKAHPMWGEELYQRRARRAFPLLVRLANSRRTITYGDLARRLRMPHARNLNFVLGSIGASLTALSERWGELIPPIEALVVNANTGLPGQGVDHFLARVTAVSATRAEQLAIAHQAVFEYEKWPAVQAALNAFAVCAQVAVPAMNSEVVRNGAQRHWWVNHKKTNRHELEGEYLWSPKKNQNGANNETYNNMLRVAPGDVVFSFADAAIRAVGIATARAFESVQPPEFGKAGEQWGRDPGWQLPVKFRMLSRPFRPKHYASDLESVLPSKHSPIRATGDGNQGVYLASVPELMAARIRELMTGEVERAVEAIKAELGQTIEEEAEQAKIEQRTDIGPTEKLSLVRSRRGQGIYRDNLSKIESACRVTGLADVGHLRASHIKPWSKCSDAEKLDGFNGLLLSPHIDHLFDRGYISFTDDGDLLVSSRLDAKVLSAWGIALPKNVGPFREEQRKYLEYHRRVLFAQAEGV